MVVVVVVVGCGGVELTFLLLGVRCWLLIAVCCLFFVVCCL